MPSVQDLIALADRQKSPFQAVLEGVTRGFGGAQENGLDRVGKLMALEEAQAQRDRQRQMDADIRAQLGLAAESKTQQDLKATGAPKPVMPSQKLDVEIKQDAAGNYSRTYKPVAPKAYQAKEYLDDKGATRIGRFNPDTGKLETAPDDATAQGSTTSLDYQKQKDREKAAVDLKELQVPGYTLGDGVRPTQKEAQDLRTSVASMKDFAVGVDRMVELIGKYGSTNTVGEGAGEMTALAANLKLTLKEVQKLGVLSSTDMALLESQIFDPSAIKSLGTRTATALEQLATTKQRAESLTSKALTARGYSPVGGGASGPAGGPAGAPKPGAVEDGYRFKGGDPANPASWEKVS